ncbi:MAG: hypothetical protein IPN90_05835 [Elusimicrobia bacterium]|nr:hypothetical protein [Elusimicrobiota bacterium]
MFTRLVVIALLVLAGPILVFEAYGIYRLRQTLPQTAESAMDAVCAQLLRSAHAKGLTGVAREIEMVSGPARDPFFESLSPFLNARLEPGFKRFLFSNDVRAKAVAEIGRLMKRREWVGSSGDMTQAVPDVLLLAEWKNLPFEEVSLTLRAVRLGMSGDGVQASVRFTHPLALQRAEKNRDRLRLALYGAAAPLAALAFLWVGNGVYPRLIGGSRHGPTP